jgi:hypothetical protein
LGGQTIDCNFVGKPKRHNVIKNDIPGRAGNIIQVIGNKSQEIQLRGIIKGASKDTVKTTLENMQGTLQTYNDGVDNITVLVDNVYIPTVGGNPNHYEFDIQCTKFEQ